MFSLISGFWEYMFGKNKYNIIVLGLDNAGKSTFIEQIKYCQYHISLNNDKSDALNTVKQRIDKLKPTIGLNIAKIECNNIEFQFWDLGLRDPFFFMCAYVQYLPMHDVFCVVVIATEIAKLRNCEKKTSNQKKKEDSQVCEKYGINTTMKQMGLCL